VANWLAAFKLVVVAALLAYVIEFARAVLSDRAPDRATTDTVLALAVVAVAIWVMQAIVFDPAAVTEAHVAQLLLVAGALIVSTIERHVEDMEAAASVGARAGASTPAGGASAPFPKLVIHPQHALARASETKGH
jgi:hypothetical protein